MRRVLETAVLVGLGAVASGCLMGFVQQARFDYSMTTAERRPVAGEPAALEAVRRGDAHVVRDGGLTLELRIRADRKVRVELVNRTRDAVSVLVDEARFVGPAGDESTIFASSRFDEVSPTAPVLTGGKATLWLAPSDRVNRHGRRTWRAKPLTGPDAIAETKEEARREGAERVGSGFELVLPLQVGERRVAYRLRFEVTGFRVERTLYA